MTALSGRLLSRIGLYGCALAILCWAGFPLLWLLKSSISPETDLTRTPPDLFPAHPTLGFYLGLFHNVAGISSGTGQQMLIPRALLNSFIIATSVMLLNLILGSPAAYAATRYRFRFRSTMLNGMLAARMVPSLVLLVPFYLLFQQAGLLNTLQGVIIAHLAITLPFTIWILRGHFDNVPLDIEKAARVDGCSRVSVFARVALPLAAPGLVVAGLFSFMLSWNEFPIALVLTQSPSAMTVQAALAGLVTYQGVSYGFLFAGSVLAALPPVLIAMVLQRHLSSGLLDSSVK